MSTLHELMNLNVEMNRLKHYALLCVSDIDVLRDSRIDHQDIPCRLAHHVSRILLLL